MSDKEKVVSDSGVETGQSKSLGASGVERSSFDDFDDSGHGSRRGTFDDDYDDDYIDPDDVKVDLSAFMDGPPGDDVADEDEEEEEEEGSEDGDEDEEEGEEGEEEDEYETEEETEVVEPIKKTSQELLEEQEQHKIKSLKEKKRALINEYLHDLKRFNHVRTKNLLLGQKIMTNIEQKQAVVEKYMQRELEEQERLKNANLLREKCNKAMKKRAKKTEKGSRKRSKQKKLKQKKIAHFSLAPEDQTVTSPTSSTDTSKLFKRKFNIDAGKDGIPNVSLNALEKEFDYNIRPVHEQRFTISDSAITTACKRNKYLRERIGRKLQRFSFMRTQFYKDAVKPKTRKRRTELMALDINQLRLKSTRFLEKKYGRQGESTIDATKSAIQPRSVAKPIPSRSYHIRGGKSYKHKLKPSDEALRLAKSKSRMALDHRKQERKIRYHSSEEYKDLHRFKYEFANHLLPAHQASVKLREELYKMLSSRHIPANHLRSAMEVKNVNDDEKNPFGRVILNYTRPSHNEKELPHVAYRILMTNLAYFRTKSQKMDKKHRKNMIELEAERKKLEDGLRQIFNEIIHGLRIFTSLCGSNDFEKKEARYECEGLVQELENFFDVVLMEMLVKMYSSISSCGFALRRLWVSESKGEGGDLHEFKEIIRCREKLRVEHKNVTQGIIKYQHHTESVLRTVRHSGRKVAGAKEGVNKMNSEMTRMKKAIGIMIEGMYVCQDTVRTQRAAEIQLKSDMGIYSSPVLAEDYQRTLKQIEDTKLQRTFLQRQYNSHVREIEKILPAPSRLVRYKLRS